MNRDYFGNLVDDKGHDILEDDDFEGEEWELDDYDEDFEPVDDWDELFFEESYMTGDSDLQNEF